MRKKKVDKLELDFDDEFNLFGISTGLADYRLAWEINSKLELKLLKSEEVIELFDKKTKVEQSYNVFHFNDVDVLNTYYLIKNKQQNTFLIQEKTNIDYFFLIRDAGLFDVENTLSTLREIKGVSAVFDFQNEPFDIGPLLTF